MKVLINVRVVRAFFSSLGWPGQGWSVEWGPLTVCTLVIELHRIEKVLGWPGLDGFCSNPAMSSSPTWARQVARHETRSHTKAPEPARGKRIGAAGCKGKWSNKGRVHEGLDHDVPRGHQHKQNKQNDCTTWQNAHTRTKV